MTTHDSNFARQVRTCTMQPVAAKLKTAARRNRQRGAGPGLRKTALPPLALRRTTELYQSSDYRIRDLFAHADVVSEGALARDGSAYFGTTSIILTLSASEMRNRTGLAELVAVLAMDPHARTRAVRIAHREASVRAQSLLKRVKTETCFRRCPAGVEATIEVEANLVARVAHRGAKEAK